MATKHQQDAKRAHVYACRKEAEAIRRRAAHAARMGNEAAANKWTRKARAFERRAELEG